MIPLPHKMKQVPKKKKPAAPKPASKGKKY